MPHITIHTIPGHSESAKQALAEKIRKAVSQEFEVDTDLVSVSIEEIEKSEWRPFIRTVAPETFYIKPGYLPEYQK